MYKFIIYMSSCAKHKRSLVGSADAEAFAKRNCRNDITGVLFFDQVHFLQLIEGNEVAIDELFRRIQTDERHSDIIVLMQGHIEKKNFVQWSMLFSPVSTDLLKSLYDNNRSKKTINFNMDDERDQLLLNSLFALIVNNENLTKKFVSHPDLDLFNHLSAREHQVLRLVTTGCSAKEIGSLLEISENTASRHIENLKEKLGCSSKYQLIKKVFSTGYINFIL